MHYPMVICRVGCLRGGIGSRADNFLAGRRGRLRRNEGPAAIPRNGRALLRPTSRCPAKCLNEVFVPQIRSAYQAKALLLGKSSSQRIPAAVFNLDSPVIHNEALVQHELHEMPILFGLSFFIAQLNFAMINCRKSLSARGQLCQILRF